MKNKRPEPSVYYPIFLNIQDKKCVVVGGGNVALRKVKMLLRHGPRITVVSPKPGREMVVLSAKRAIRLIQRDYRTGDLGDSTLAIAATDVGEVNAKVAQEARKRGVLVNVTDDPGSSDFIIPSSFRRGALTVAVSTSGMSPAFAKKIRRRLERGLGAEYASLLSLIGEVRSALRKKGYSIHGETWQEALDLDSLLRLIRRGQGKKAKASLIRKLGRVRSKS